MVDARRRQAAPRIYLLPPRPPPPPRTLPTLLHEFRAWTGGAIARTIAISPRYHTYSLSAAQLTWSFQSTKGPWGLVRHAQTWSSKNAGMVKRFGASTYRNT